MTPEQFVSKWKDAALGERQGAQSHWIDLCKLLGKPAPSDHDQQGETYCFERGALKSSGGNGWADVWFKDHFAVEYKGPEKDLKKAYDQLQRYHDWLDHPPLLIVTDTQRFEVHTKFTRTAPRVFRFSIDDFLTDAPVAVETTEDNPPGLTALQVLQYAFEDPDRLKPTLTTDRVTQDASANFAVIAQSMRDRGLDAHEAAHFLMKVLFCLFAEDVGLLPGKLFERILAAGRHDPEELRESMHELFAAMREGKRFGADRIKWFNGALFDERPALEMTPVEIEALMLASKLDWAHVEPSIFGTLFERSLDPEQRAQLGAHYTSYDDIMLVVDPVVLRPLRREWDAVREQVKPLLAEIEEVRDKLAALPPARGRAKQGSDRDKFERRFKKLRDEADAAYSSLLDLIRHVRILDPACGSGNFLYVALAQLKDMEKRVIQEAYALKLDLAQQTPLVDPSQLYGIEINAYAHELAQVVVWIGYIQWHVRNAYSFPDRPILKPLTNIRCMDALLVWRDAGAPPADAAEAAAAQTAAGKVPATPTARRPEWPEADYIIGNPPFLGGKKLRDGLGDEYVDTLFKAYDGDVAREADLSVYWHERARALIEAGKVKRAGLLATQGIRGGANQKTLKRILETGNIFEAWSDRDWILSGANVHVSIVCQDNGSESVHTLDGKSIGRVTADLGGNAGIDLSSAARLPENEGRSFMGITPAGPFDIPETTAAEWLAVPNPDGRSNAEVLRPYVNGKDLLQRSSRRWIIDFGTDTPVEVAALYEAPFEFVRSHVKSVREVGQRAKYRQNWWRFTRPRPEMREALSPLRRYIATSMVAKHRVFCWLPVKALPANLLIVVAREDDYFFGVLHSVAHERWALRLGTQLREKESGARYTPTTSFETFPFPWPPGAEPAADPLVRAIAAAAKELNDLREGWLNPAEPLPEADLKKRTLTNLYNKRPEWLHLAHLKLDRAVFAAYGWADLKPEDLYATLRPNPGESKEAAAKRQKAAEEDVLKRLLALNHQRAQ